VDPRARRGAAFHVDRVATRELLVLDLRQLLACGVLEDVDLVDAQRLAVDLVPALALVVLDPRIVAGRRELLLHLEAMEIAHAATIAPADCAHLTPCR